MYALRGDVDAGVALLSAILHRAVGLAERATHRVGIQAMKGEANLHLDVDGAPERIEAEDRIVGKDIGAADGFGGDKVPVYGVAERFVDTHAIHVDRNALR